MLTANARRLKCKRYYLKAGHYPVCPNCGVRHETEDDNLDRVSLGNPIYREMLVNNIVSANSPTWFNIGTGRGTGSGCFKFDIRDSMLDTYEDGRIVPSGSIMDVAYKAAAVQKWGGGVGYYFGNLREKGAPIASTHGRACGPVACMRYLYDKVAMLITQGGVREGAQMGILPVDHPDIREFIHAKDCIKDWQDLYTSLVDQPWVTPRQLELVKEASHDLATFNISVSLPDWFMKKVIEFRDGVSTDSSSYDLFMEMAESACRTGDPGCYFVDTAEAKNPTPWLGILTGTNPCGEVPLLDNEPCNLGSINLTKFILEGRLDFEKLRDVTKLAIQYLDDVLDANLFPTPEIAEAARKTRKLGLGVMGWADTLAMLHIHYDTPEAVALGESVMETINNAALKASINLSKTKSPNPAFTEKYGLETAYSMPRNATRTCIAPTGSIYILAGLSSSGIEPHYRDSWERTLGDGTKLQESIQDYNGFRPKFADEISPEWHIKHQVAFQKHTDLAVSKTINLPESATPQDIFDIYVTMWQMGCKGGTIYRNNSRTVQVLSSKTEEKHNGHTHPPSLVPYKKKMPRRAEAIRWGFSITGIDGFIHAGKFETGEVGEIFLTFGKDGTTIAGLADAVAICMSIGLQYGVPLETFVEKLQGRRFDPYGLTDDPDIKTTASIVDYLARWLSKEFLNNHVTPEQFTGLVCDDCGAPAIHQDGCLYCAAQCGWSRC